MINVNEVAQKLWGSTTSRRVERRAVVRYCNALESAVYHDPTWKQLDRQARTRKPPTWDESRDLIELVASTLLKAQADILRQCGYRSPPPPEVEDLLSQTRRSVLTKGRNPWGAENLDNVRFALAYFSNMLRVHLGNPDELPSGALLGRVRRLGPATLLLLLLVHVETAAGSELEIRLVTTARDHVTFTITVPMDDADLANFAASLVYSQVSNVAEAINLCWIGPAKDEASLADWYGLARARTTGPAVGTDIVRPPVEPDHVDGTEMDDDHGPHL
jgi:hypothetical protein